MCHGKPYGMFYVENHVFMGLPVDAQRLEKVLREQDGVVSVDMGEECVYRIVRQWIVLMRREICPACGEVVGRYGHGGVYLPFACFGFLGNNHHSRQAQPSQEQYFVYVCFTVHYISFCRNLSNGKGNIFLDVGL